MCLLCVNICSSCGPFLYFSMSHPHFGNCVYCKLTFSKETSAKQPGFRKKKGTFLAILQLLHTLERNSNSKKKKGPSWCPEPSGVWALALFQWHPAVTLETQIWQIYAHVADKSLRKCKLDMEILKKSLFVWFFTSCIKHPSKKPQCLWLKLAW